MARCLRKNSETGNYNTIDLAVKTKMAALPSLSIGEVWRTLTGFLDPNLSKNQDFQAINGFLSKVCGNSAELKGMLSQELKEWFLERFNRELRHHIAPRFWSSFQDEITAELLVSSVKDLLDMVKIFEDPLKNFQKLAEETKIVDDVEERMHLFIGVVVFSNPPAHFKLAVKEFFSKVFKVHHVLNKEDKTMEEEEDEDDTEPSPCEGCGCEKESCCCQQVLDTFCSWNSMLHSLGVLKKVVSDAFVSVIHSEVHGHEYYALKIIGLNYYNYLTLLINYNYHDLDL